MLKGIVGATHHATGNGPEALRKGLGQIQMIGYLLKILMKAIVLKKALIIGRVVLHTKSRTGKTLNKQPPEIIVFTKIDGPIHGPSILVKTIISGGCLLRVLPVLLLVCRNY